VRTLCRAKEDVIDGDLIIDCHEVGEIVFTFGDVRRMGWGVKVDMLKNQPWRRSSLVHPMAVFLEVLDEKEHRGILQEALGWVVEKDGDGINDILDRSEFHIMPDCG